MNNVNLNVLNERDNPVLYRKELLFEVEHKMSSSPKKKEVKMKISSIYTASPELVYIMRMKTKTNEWKTVGTAHLYSSPENANKIVPKHLLKRELPREKKPTEEKKTKPSETAKKEGK